MESDVVCLSKEANVALVRGDLAEQDWTLRVT